jgi:hypothetical protein
MASLDELALSLKTLYESDFWISLRFEEELDSATLKEMLSLLNEYTQQATSDSKIHKSVARLAFDLFHDLTASAYHATKNNRPQRDKLDNAVEELAYILDLLF